MNQLFKSYQGVDYCRCKVDMRAASLLVYVFWLDGILIDSGPSKLRNSIDEFCRTRRLDKIIHTHFHEDHTGNTAYLSQKYNAPSYIGPEFMENCQQKARLPLYRRVFWGKRLAFEPLPLPGVVENGNTRLKMIPTPGHTLDHVVFLDEKEGRLFTGDTYVHCTTRIIMRQENLPLLMESLRRVLSENFDTIFCSHAGVVENGHQLMRRKLEYLEELQAEVLLFHKQGWGVEEINKKLFPKKLPIQFFSSGEWSTCHIVRSLLQDTAI